MACSHEGGEKQWYAVELMAGRGYEGAHADSARVEGGALVLTTGQFPGPVELVCAWGPGQWAWVAPVDHCPRDDDE